MDRLRGAFSEEGFDVTKKGKRTNDELEKVAKIYSFKKANRFTKDMIYVFETIYSSYAKNLISNLNIRFGIPMNVILEGISTGVYEEHAKAMPTDCVITTFKLAPMQGLFLMIHDNEFGFRAIEGLCGGGSSDYEKLNREFTDVEKNLLKIVAEHLIQPQRYYWREFTSVTPTVKSIDFNPMAIQFVDDNEPVLVVSISIELGDRVYPIKFIFPYNSLSNVVDRVFTLSKKTEATVDAEQQAIIQSHAMKTTVEVDALLGRAKISLGEARALDVGDVVILDTKITDLLKVRVGGVNCFEAQPGTSSKQMSVQIVKVNKNKSN